MSITDAELLEIRAFVEQMKDRGPSVKVGPGAMVVGALGLGDGMRGKLLRMILRYEKLDAGLLRIANADGGDPEGTSDEAWRLIQIARATLDRSR